MRPAAPQQPVRPAAPQQPPRPVPPPQPPKKKSTGKGLTITLIIILVLAILVGGLFICHEMEVIDLNIVDDVLGTDIFRDFDDDDDDDDDREDEDDQDDGEESKKPNDQDGEGEATTPTEPEPVVTYEYRYEIVKADYTWTEAKAEAERRGGYLATINSHEEYEKICQLADQYDLVYLWLGANLPAGTTEWKWSDGTPIPLENYYWYRDGSTVEPSYMDKSDGAREDCLCLWNLSTGSYRWTLNDQRNDFMHVFTSTQGKVGFVIEYKVEVTR